MKVVDAIQTRRSIHDFKKQLVNEAVLQEIFQIASWAPNHRLKEPWNVMVFQKEGAQSYADLVIESYLKQGFAKGYSAAKTDKMMNGIKRFLINIPHHALVYLDRDPDLHKFEEDYSAVCAFIQNAQLAAWERGVGALWTTSPYIHDPEFIKGIGLHPASHKVAGVIQMGYPARIPEPKARRKVQLTFQSESFNKKI
ncbi:nitroreductase family protein [Halobacillus naozhouensis]|uniref:Nitroreductase n=1 Tax=Halobacillus naozhouensis TaxID=554880 RepID=A0ABY8IUE0_9BACI|nr:nitroreductase [Halobacillus naozhouensis]WFT73712.1 nitroreductase [Halobacillus naozhouensis]